MEDFPGTLALYADGALGADGKRDGPFAAGPGLYVLDPEVRVILRYAPGFDPFGVLEDLKRLLKYSWLGEHRWFILPSAASGRNQMLSLTILEWSSIGDDVSRPPGRRGS
jgi:hypothetical protein